MTFGHDLTSVRLVLASQAVDSHCITLTYFINVILYKKYVCTLDRFSKEPALTYKNQPTSAFECSIRALIKGEWPSNIAHRGCNRTVFNQMFAWVHGRSFFSGENVDDIVRDHQRWF